MLKEESADRHKQHKPRTVQPSARTTTLAQKKHTAHSTEDQLGTHQTAAHPSHPNDHPAPPANNYPAHLPIQDPKGTGHIAPAGDVEVAHRPLQARTVGGREATDVSKGRHRPRGSDAALMLQSRKASRRETFRVEICELATPFLWFKEFIDHQDPHLLRPPLQPDPQSYHSHYLQASREKMGGRVQACSPHTHGSHAKSRNVRFAQKVHTRNTHRESCAKPTHRHVQAPTPSRSRPSRGLPRLKARRDLRNSAHLQFGLTRGSIGRRCARQHVTPVAGRRSLVRARRALARARTI